MRAAANFAAWWTEARWVWTVCLRLLASRLRFEPGPFCAWVQHANHSATDPPYIGWQWRNFDANLTEFRPSINTISTSVILWVKVLEMYSISLWYRWNTLCWQASGHTDIFINRQIESYLNDMINLRPLTRPHISHVIPTIWRSYRGHRFCDVTFPYVYTTSLP